MSRGWRAVFNGDAARPRGDLQAVVKAILLDPEARGDLKSDPNYGRLRHPAQFIANLLRAFDARSADGTGRERRLSEPAGGQHGHGRLPATLRLQLLLAVGGVPGTNGVRGPEFGLLLDVDGAAAGELRQHDGVLARLRVGANAPTGTSLDLSRAAGARRRPGRSWSTHLNVLLLHGTMSDGHARQRSCSAVTAVAGDQPAQTRPDRRLPGRHVVAVSGGEVAMPRHPTGIPAPDGHGCVGYALGAAAFVAGVAAVRPRSTCWRRAPTTRHWSACSWPAATTATTSSCRSSTTEYNAYAAVRSAVRPGDSARQRCCRSRRSASAARSGCIPAWPSSRRCGSSRRSSVVCNVGPLVQPLTRQDYQAGAPRPYQLFSHSDQVAQWQTSIADRVSATGWGGRTADRFAAARSGFPMVTALSGGIFTRGQTTSPLSIAPAPTALNQVLVLNGFGTDADEVARRHAIDSLRSARQRVHARRRRQQDHATGGGHRPASQRRRLAGDGVSRTPRSAIS